MASPLNLSGYISLTLVSEEYQVVDIRSFLCVCSQKLLYSDQLEVLGVRDHSVCGNPLHAVTGDTMRGEELN